MLIDFHLNAHFPGRRGMIRIGRLDVPVRFLNFAIFFCLSSSFPYLLVVKFGAMVAQFIAAVVLVNEATVPQIYIPLGLLTFIFGIMEGGAALLRD